MRKPNNKTICEHVACVNEINNYLMDFPPAKDGERSTVLSEDKLVEVLEFGLPNS